MPIEHVSDLALFVEVVESGSLSEAGRVLGMSPASASKRLNRLEESIGTRLISRTTRQVRPTEDGRLFHARAVRILAELSEAEDVLDTSRREPRGHLKITVPANFGRLHAMPIIGAFLCRHAHVTIDVVLTDHVIDLVGEGIDVAIRIAEMKDSSLIARKLADNNRVVCASPDYIARHGAPETPRDLADHECLRMHGQELWRFAGEGGEHVARISGPLTTNSGDIIKEAALNGVGIGLKSLFDVGDDIRSGRLVPLLSDYEVDPDVAIYAVYPSARHVSARARALIDAMVAAFSPVPPWERDTHPSTS